MSTSAHPANDEKQELLARLSESRQRFVASLRGVTDTQAVFSPGEGRWSILECAEHVANAERGMLRLYQKLAVPGTTDRAIDEQVRTMATDRLNRKSEAPERSRPTGRFMSLKDACETFVAAREETLSYLQGLNEDLRSKTVPHPLGVTLDGFQLFLVMAAHPERHVLQIEEIKTDPAFPRADK